MIGRVEPVHRHPVARCRRLRSARHPRPRSTGAAASSRWLACHTLQIGNGEATSCNEGCNSSTRCGSTSASKRPSALQTDRIPPRRGDGHLAGPFEAREVDEPFVARARHAVGEPRRERLADPVQVTVPRGMPGTVVARELAKEIDADASLRHRVGALQGSEEELPRVVAVNVDPFDRSRRRRRCRRAVAGPPRSQLAERTLRPNAACSAFRSGAESGGRCMAPFQSPVGTCRFRQQRVEGRHVVVPFDQGRYRTETSQRVLRTKPTRRRRRRCRDHRSAGRVLQPGVGRGRRGEFPGWRAAAAPRRTHRGRDRGSLHSRTHC